MKKLIIYFCMLLAFSRCSTGKQETKNKSKRATEIVLINAGKANRQLIGNALTKISLCKPKVVGINFVFHGTSNPRGDSILSLGLKGTNNVILASNLEDGELVTSEHVFTSNSQAEGLFYVGYSGEFVDRHMIYISHNNEMLWSFPVTIASYFKPERAAEIMHRAIGNEFYKIRFDYELNDFQTIDFKNLDKLDCGVLENKIVLIGDLDPDHDDVYNVEGTPGMHGTVIMANCIENILEDYFEKTD